MSVRERARRPWVLSGLTAILLPAGCGGSSGAKSTPTSTAKSAQQTTGMPSQQAATGVATVPQPAVSSSTGAAGVVVGSSGGVTATLHAGTHHPKVEVPWPIRFTVSSGGRAARCWRSPKPSSSSAAPGRRQTSWCN